MNNRTTTVREAAVELSQELDVPIPEGGSSEEFRLSIAQTLRINELATSIISLLREGHLRPCSPDGGYLTGAEDVSESTQVKPDEAKKVLQELGGWCFLDIPTDNSGGLTSTRIDAIVKVARRLGYEPLSVRTGGKRVIESECLEKLAGDPCRFTPDTFKKAWQAARDAGQIDVENVETYRSR